jgi:hypothetical protein
MAGAECIIQFYLGQGGSRTNLCGVIKVADTARDCFQSLNIDNLRGRCNATFHEGDEVGSASKRFDTTSLTK